MLSFPSVGLSACHFNLYDIIIIILFYLLLYWTNEITDIHNTFMTNDNVYGDVMFWISGKHISERQNWTIDAFSSPTLIRNILK